MEMLDLKNYNRAEKAYLNVASYIALYPNSFIKTVEKVIKPKIISIRVIYQSHKSEKTYANSFSFYRFGEAEQAQQFVNLLKENYNDLLITERTEM